MNIFISMVIGMLLGYATSASRPMDGLEDLIRNVVLGIVGAFVGIQVTKLLLDSGEPGLSVFPVIVASLIGASILLFVVNKARTS